MFGRPDAWLFSNERNDGFYPRTAPFEERFEKELHGVRFAGRYIIGVATGRDHGCFM